MTPEEIKELKDLIGFLKENNIGEFDLERGDLKVRLKFAGAAGAADLEQVARLLAAQSHAAPAVLPEVYAAPAAASTPAAPAPAATTPAEDPTLHVVKSPIVGTFYDSPSPGAAAFVKIGDQVETGQVLCIVEAMKLMNEIESDAAGELVRCFVKGGQPVEYGQPLFAVRPR